jgi:hypothetical protein
MKKLLLFMVAFLLFSAFNRAQTLSGSIKVTASNFDLPAMPIVTDDNWTPLVNVNLYAVTISNQLSHNIYLSYTTFSYASSNSTDSLVLNNMVLDQDSLGQVGKTLLSNRDLMFAPLSILIPAQASTTLYLKADVLYGWGASTFT